MKMKSILTPVIAIVAAAVILYGTGIAMAGTAAVNAEAELQEMFKTILPGSTSFEWEDYEGEDEAIQAVYKGDNGYVIQSRTYGYAGYITLLVGVSNEGMVTGLVVRELSETYGLGAEALTDTAFLSQYLGTAGEAEVGTNVDAISGATVSSKAVTKAVNSAVAFVTGADVSSAATEWGG